MQHPVGQITQDCHNKLQRIMNAAARVMSSTRKNDRGLTWLLHAELHWLDVADRVTYKLSWIDLRVGSSKSTWAFQVGSSQSVVASPSKFSGAVGLIIQVISSRLEKSTWPIILHLVVLSYAAIGEFGQIGQFATYFSIPVCRLGRMSYRVSTLRTALIVGFNS